MEPRLSMIALGVKDIQVSRKFYNEGLGFPMSKASNPGITFFMTIGSILSIYPLEESSEDKNSSAANGSQQSNNITISYSAKTKDDVDKVLNEAKLAGGKIIRAAENTPWGGYSGHFCDPDGHLWEAVYADFCKFDDKGNILLEE